MMVNALVGLKMWGPARAADLRSFQAGPARRSLSRLGRLREVGTYALHVQCAWRLDEGKLCRASSADDVTVADEALMHAFGTSGREVIAVEQSSDGLLRLHFADGFTLEIEPERAGVEAWRLFRPGTEHPHLVCSGATTEFE